MAQLPCLLDKWSSTCFLLAVFTLICYTFSPSLSWEERDRLRHWLIISLDLWTPGRKRVAISPSDCLGCLWWTGGEVRLIITNYDSSSRLSVWTGQTTSPGGWDCQDIRRGHYHHSHTIIPLCATQYKQYRGEGVENTSSSLCQSDQSISQLFLSPLRSNSINC